VRRKTNKYAQPRTYHESKNVKKGRREQRENVLQTNFIRIDEPTAGGFSPRGGLAANPIFPGVQEKRLKNGHAGNTRLGGSLGHDGLTRDGLFFCFFWVFFLGRELGGKRNWRGPGCSR